MAEDRAALLAEAYRRGILPTEQKAAYEEALRRGLIDGPKPEAPAAPTETKPADPIGTTSAGLTGQAYQGMTFGFGDEINAGTRAGMRWLTDTLSGKDADFGKLYAERLAAERGDLKATEKAHPVASFGAQALGSMAMAPAKAALPALGPLEAWALPKGQLTADVAGAVQAALPEAKSGARLVGQLAGTGGAMGALSGAGNAEGGMSDRLAGAVEGGLLGAGLGVALPAAIAGGGKVLTPVKNLIGLGNADKAAENLVLRRLAQDGTSLDDAAQRLADTGGKPFALMDVADENTLGLARAAAGVPSTARVAARDMLEGRQAGQVGRLAEDVRATVAPQNYHDEAARLMQQRADDAARLYPDTLSTKPVWSERLQQFLDDPVTTGGLRQGVEIQRLESLARNEPFNPEDMAIRFNAAGDPEFFGVPNMRTLNVVKKGIDNMLEGYRDKVTGRLALDEKGRAIDEVRRALLGELDSLNPKYAAARQAWAGPTQAKDLMARGRDFISMDAPDIAKAVAGMSDTDKEFFRVGVAQALRDRLYRDTAQPGHNAALRISGEGLNEKLTAALGKDQADKLLKQIGNEARMTANRNFVRGGSQTQNKMADVADMEADPSILASLMRGDLKGAALDAAKGAVRRASGLTPSTANSLGGLLYETDPTMNAIILSRLQNRLTANQAAEKSTAAAAKAYASGVGVAVPGLLN